MSVGVTKQQDLYRGLGGREKSLRQERRGAEPLGEMRILRFMGLHNTVHRTQWDEFLDYFGRLNHANGTTRSIGSLACTLVSAQEMQKMMAEKYPKIIHQPKKWNGLLKRIGRDFNEFSRNMAWLGDQDYNTKNNADSRSWHAADFNANHFDSFGATVFGIDLSFEPVLHNEQSQVRSYLRSEGFNTNHIDIARRHHVGFFRSFRRLENTNLRMPIEWPSYVLLDEPRAEYPGYMPSLPQTHGRTIEYKREL